MGRFATKAGRHWPLVAGIGLALGAYAWYLVARQVSASTRLEVNAFTVSFAPTSDIDLRRLRTSSLIVTGGATLVFPAGALRTDTGSVVFNDAVSHDASCEDLIEFANVQLERLAVAKGALVTFDTDHTDPAALQISSASTMHGVLVPPEASRASATRIVGQDCRVDGKPFGRAVFTSRTVLGGAISFSVGGGRSGVSASLIDVAEPLPLLDGVTVRQLAFTRKAERLVSTIDTAKVTGDMVHTTEITRPTGTGSSDYLNLASEDVFTVQALALNKGLALAAHGRASALSAGPAGDQRDLTIGFVEWVLEKSLLASALASALIGELIKGVVMPVLRRSDGDKH